MRLPAPAGADRRRNAPGCIPGRFTTDPDWCTFGAASCLSVPAGARSMVGVAQSVRAPDCGSGGRRFDPGRPPWAWPGCPPGFRARADSRALVDRTVDSTYDKDLPCRRRGTPVRRLPGVSRRAGRSGGKAAAGRLSPSGRIFDNRGHEKRAGPSSRGALCLSGLRSAGGPQGLREARGSINADSEQRIRMRVHVYESYSSDL